MSSSKPIPLHRPEDRPFEIETGIPLPVTGRGRGVGPTVAALRQLAAAPIGASVFIPGKRASNIGPYITSAAGTGWAASRSAPGGVRVWKIAEPKKAVSQ